MKLENELHTTENFDLIKRKKKESDLTVLRRKIAGLFFQIKNADEEGEKPSICYFLFYKSRNYFFLQIKLFLSLLMNLEM
jgi:hypothetical protein